MRQRHVTVLLLALGAGLAAAYLVYQTVGDPRETLKVSDPAAPISVRAGDDFRLVLKANPTTSFAWQMTGPPDEAIARFVKREYVADQPVADGSGGKDVWTFQAVGPGETTITLVYVPPSDNDVPSPDAQRVTFTVRVR